MDQTDQVIRTTHMEVTPTVIAHTVKTPTVTNLILEVTLMDLVDQIPTTRVIHTIINQILLMNHMVVHLNTSTVLLVMKHMGLEINMNRTHPPNWDNLHLWQAVF